MVIIVKNENRNILKLYFLLFGIVFIIHFFFHFSNDDVTYFSHVLDTMSLGEFIKLRYSTWTSRLLIEGLLVFISRNIYLWRILDSLVFVLFIWCVQKLCFKNISIKNTLFVAFIVLLLPFFTMTEAGFCATTMNYFWPLTFMLFSFVPIRDMYRGNSIHLEMVPFYFFSSLYACNQEQCVCVVLVVSLLACCYFLKKKIFPWYSFSLVLLSLGSLAFILSCPGNSLRSIHEMEYWYVDYKNAMFMDKVFLGVVSSTSVLFSYFFVLLLFSFILMIGSIKVHSSIFKKCVASTQFLIIFILCIFRVYCLLFDKTFVLFDYYTDIGNVFFNNILLFLCCIFLFLIFIYLLYSFKRKTRYYYVMILLLGCGTRLMMGFSPTIFASRSRTAIFLYFSLIILIINILNDIKYLLKKRENYFIGGILIIFIIANLGVLFLKVL